MLSGCHWWISIRSTKTVVNASLESFVHKALKDKQIECNHRIVCHGRDVLAVLPTGLGKSATCQLKKSVVSYGPYSQRHIKNHLRTPCFFVSLQSEQYLHQVLLLKTLLITNETGGRVLQNKPYFCRSYCTALHVNSRCSMPCVIPAHEATSGNCARFILIGRCHRRHSR